MTTKHVIKRCEKCGHRSDVPVRQRRCYRTVPNAWGGMPVSCWGKLSKVARVAKRQTIEQALDRAHQELANAITRVKRATTSVGHWQRKIKYLERKIDERDHPRPPKPKKPKLPHVRSIALEEGGTP